MDDDGKLDFKFTNHIDLHVICRTNPIALYLCIVNNILYSLF